MSQPVYWPKQLGMPDVLAVETMDSVVVWVPHADDESIGCGGLIATLAEQGCRVLVVLVTDSSGAGGLPEGTSEQRREEFLRAVAVLGNAIEAVCWDFADGALSSADRRLQYEILTFVKEREIQWAIAPWPMDVHPDHAALGEAVVQAYLAGAFAEGVVFYEVWTPLPASHVLPVSSEAWEKKLTALSQHQTALECVDYVRAITGLGAYRSLLRSDGHAGEGFVEAFCVWQAVRQTPSLENIHYRLASTADGDQVQRLFVETFGNVPPQNWWSWKYLHSALISVVAEYASAEEKEVVAFYGVLPRTLLWQGHQLQVCQIADVMVKESLRGKGGRKGVFYHTSFFFLHHFIHQKQQFDFAFGFPTERALLTGVKTDLYKYGENLFSWQCSTDTPEGVFGIKSLIQPANQVGDWQWLRKCRKHLSPFSHNHKTVWLEKTPDYWRWRFGEHPEKSYKIIRFSLLGKLLGSVVIKPDKHNWEIMDIALSHPRWGKWVLRTLSMVAKNQGVAKLRAWGSEPAILALSMVLGGTHESAGKMALPSNSFLDVRLQNTPCLAVLGGDTDFR